MIEEDHQSNYHNVAETRMTRFLMAIKKYGREKTDRINEDADAEEEFALAKINLEATNYNEEHFKKIDDGIKVAEKIFKSRKVNECRMQEMKVRFDMIEQIQGDVKEKLKKQAEDPTEYRKLLKQLIMQGLIKLIEEKVEIQCLRSDETLIS